MTDEFVIETDEGDVLKDYNTNKILVFKSIDEAEDYCEYWEISNSFIVKR